MRVITRATAGPGCYFGLLVPFSHIELDSGMVGFNFSISESAVCTTKEIYTLVELSEAVSSNGCGSLPCRTLQRSIHMS
jgi:hypothetical protein